MPLGSQFGIKAMAIHSTGGDYRVLNDVMTVAEAARRWGLTTRAVRKAIQEGRLQATRSDGTWLIAYPDMVSTYGEESAGKRGK